MGRCRTYVKVLAVGLLEYVSVEFPCSVIKIMDIEDVIEKSTAEEQVQIKIPVAEIMGCGHSELRQAVAYLPAVILAALTCLNDISVPVFNKPFPVGIYADIFPHVEIA